MAFLISVLGTRQITTGSALLRISLGLCILLEYFVNYSNRHYLWGDNSLVPASDRGSNLTLYALSSESWYFETVFHGGILVALLFVVGVGGRWITCALYLFTLSLQQRNLLILDGGDNVLAIVLVFLMFACLGGVREKLSTASATLHNIAIMAVVMQMGMIYLSTGLYKVMGEVWQNGTALYYVLRSQWFTWPGVSEIVYENGHFVTALTYGTVLFEISFPFMLFNRWTRYLAIGVGVSMHCGIALLMGLFPFSWTMISLYFLLISDREYEWIVSHIGVWWSASRDKMLTYCNRSNVVSAVCGSNLRGLARREEGGGE